MSALVCGKVWERWGAAGAGAAVLECSCVPKLVTKGNKTFPVLPRLLQGACYSSSQGADLEALLGLGRFYEVLLSHPTAWEAQAAFIKDLEEPSYSHWANQHPWLPQRDGGCSGSPLCPALP